MAFSNWYHPKIYRRDVDFQGGWSVVGEAVTANAHELNTLDLDAGGAATRYLKINLKPDDFPDDTEQGTGVGIPSNAIVKNVWVRVNTEESTAATKTLDVGTDSSDGGVADGFLDGVSVASDGLVKGTLTEGAQTLGSLLTADEGGGGELVPEPDIASGGKEVTYTAGDAGGFDEADVDIFIEYVILG